MKELDPESIQDKLHRLDQQIRKRDSLGTLFYATGLLAAIALMFLPFDLSRVGSVVLIVALAYMISRLYVAGRKHLPPQGDFSGEYFGQQLSRLNAQIDLGQSAFYHLPFVVGANLFWMGLPLSERPETKALLDCLFLAVTVFVFSALYLANQKTLQRHLIPLRRDLQLAAETEEQTEQM